MMNSSPLTYDDIKRVKDIFDNIDFSIGRVHDDLLENLLKRVLANYLGHEPTKDDAKDCIILTRETDPNYYLSYKNNYLGVISHRMDIGINGCKMVFVFDPKL